MPNLSQRIERAQQKTTEAPEAPQAADVASYAVVPAAPAPQPTQVAARVEWLRDIRRKLQVEVISASNVLLGVEDEADIRKEVEGIIDRFVARNGVAFTRDERLRLIEEVIAEVRGFGPIEPLLKDPSITEVMVNGPDQIYIEQAGKLKRVDVAFLNDDHVLRVIDRIITPLGRRIDQSSPRVDARLPDGSRVNAVIEPLSLIGPVITIRKFSAKPFEVADLVRFGTATEEMFEFLKACVVARLNVFVSGGTGSGKTTTLNVLSSFIPEDERIVTIEDAAELQLRQEHVVTLEARPPNLEGEGEISTRMLLRNSLHMRPDRIIVGECRGGEALDMIQAMMVGQEGSLSTGHANSSADMLRRLETMVLMAGYELPLRSIREQIASAVDLIVHTARLKDGTRKVVNITEVYGLEDDEILTQDIFAFEQTGVDENGKIQGTLKATGIRPTFMGKFKASGVDLPPGEFGIPSVSEDEDGPARQGKGRWVMSEAPVTEEVVASTLGRGRAVMAGGMVYVSSVGPVDLETGQVVIGPLRAQAAKALENLRVRLEEQGSSLDKVVWANWTLASPDEFETFSRIWTRWFPGDAPVGQLMPMPAQQKRAGFRLSLAVIAEA